MDAGVLTVSGDWPTRNLGSVARLEVDGRAIPFETAPDGSLVVSPAAANAELVVCVSVAVGVLAQLWFRTGTDGCATQPLAFQSDRTGDYGTWPTTRPTASARPNPVNLTNSPDSHETAPARSPTLLAYVSDRGGDREPPRVVDLATR